MFTRREILAGGALVTVRARAADPAYLREMEKFRQDREKRLQADDSWLTVAGLYWLEEGKEHPEIAPGVTFVLRKKQVFARATRAAGIQLKGQPFTEGVLRGDNSGSPDVLTIGQRSYIAIERGGWYGIRVKDPANPARKQFHGLHWYPVKEEYRITGRLIPHKEPRILSVPTVIAGMNQQMPSPGVVEFALRGQKYTLEPVLEDEELFFIFRDQTSGRTTYPAGRFLYSEKPKGDRVELDFNQAQNPPCAFTPYATCPIPPRQNRLAVSIEAGELDYKH